MQTIIITRHYSGFTNVADTYQVGDHEADGNADVTAYDLPTGYSVQDGLVYDHAGWQCEVLHGDHGGPALYSHNASSPVIMLEVAQ
jgi:hypothetical protein